MIKRIFLVFTMLLLSLTFYAQDKQDIEMADVMRSNGKIYVVVAVILTIFAFLIIYLIRLDKKMTRIEKNINS